MQWYQRILACPDCKPELTQESSDVLCCAQRNRSWSSETPTSMVPHHPQPQSISFTRLEIDIAQALSELDLSKPRRSYDGPMPGRDSTNFLLFLRSINAQQGRVLDLGCGPQDQRECFSYFGYEHVGIDIPRMKADIFADGYFLPFSDEQFDVVFSYAGLERLYNPFLAIQEVRRILKLGGLVWSRE